MSIPLPRWLTKGTPAEEREEAEAKFHTALREIWGGPAPYDEDLKGFVPPADRYPVGSVPRVRVLLRTAAIYYSPTGSLSRLSEACEKHPRTLSTYSVSRKQIPDLIARKIEKLVGRKILPREVLNPEVFGDG